MMKIIGLLGLEGPKWKVLFIVAPFTKFFTVFFILKGEAKSPPPQFDTHTKKISQPSENLPWIIQHTAAAPGHLILLGALIPQNTWATSLHHSPQNTKVFCTKTLEDGLSVSVMAVFTASEGVCVLQVVCKRSGNNMWREVCKCGAIYSSQIYRALPTRNIKEVLCQILHMLLSASPFLSPEKKKSPILIREQIYSLTGTAFGSTRKKVCMIAQLVSVWILSLELLTAVHTKAFVGDVKPSFHHFFLLAWGIGDGFLAPYITPEHPSKSSCFSCSCWACAKRVQAVPAARNQG